MAVTRHFACACVPAALATLALFAGCSRGPGADKTFVAVANRYVEAMLESDPESATAYGDHRYDHRLTDRSVAGQQARRDLAAAYLDTLASLDEKKLSQGNRIDLAILRNHLETVVFEHDVLREQEWNPLPYDVGGALYGLIARDFAPLRDRLEAVRDRLDAVPDALAAARAALKRPPRVYTETAITQNRGDIQLVLDELQPFLDQEPELRGEFVDVRSRAIAALEDYGRWLQDVLLPRSDGDFRLGRENFARKLKLTLESDLGLDEIRRQARADLDDTRRTMYETALPLYREYYPERAGVDTMSVNEVVGEVLDRIAESRPDADTIVPKARDCLKRATAFVSDHDLVTLPADPLDIIVMPEFQRGVAVAYCDAPGPLAHGEKTFFSISPPPADWSDARKESYFREYNDAMLEDLTAHEAMPGHYLQLAHANRFEAPTPVRALFGSGVFVEGWATYAEQLMAEQGFGGPEFRMEQLKMRLRLIINAIIDQGIHCDGMAQSEAMDLMTNQGFQEEGEAAGKWKRAQLSSTQLSTYYVGNTEINRLRDAARAKEGDAFDLKKFHDRLLSFGSPAPRYVRELMGLR